MVSPSAEFYSPLCFIAAPIGFYGNRRSDRHSELCGVGVGCGASALLEMTARCGYSRMGLASESLWRRNSCEDRIETKPSPSPLCCVLGVV